MPVDPAAVGREYGPQRVSWSARDAILYALGVGAGSDCALEELAFTTETSALRLQKVLPTFPLVIESGAEAIPIGSFDKGQTVHGDQSLILHEPLSPDGSALATTSVEAIWDKGSGALVRYLTALRAEDGRLLAEHRAGVFIRGAGGFGGESGPRFEWAVPTRLPDQIVEQHTQENQALLYRLSGDRNPLHSDPPFARAAGFPRPILHGLCSFGFVARAVLAMAGHDPGRFKAMQARFRGPVFPGDTLRTEFWVDGGSMKFRSFVNDRLVLDAGEAEIG